MAGRRLRRAEFIRAEQQIEGEQVIGIAVETDVVDNQSR